MFARELALIAAKVSRDVRRMLYRIMSSWHRSRNFVLSLL